MAGHRERHEPGDCLADGAAGIRRRPAAPLLFQEGTQRACPGRVLQLLKRFGLDLPDALARDRLMAPEATAEAMKAYIEETNRLNRERRASGATDHKELADMEKKIATMIAVIEDGGYQRV